MAEQQTGPQTVTCHWHPTVSTGLSCGQCRRPICTDCMVQVPVGIRCRECGRAQPLPTFDVRPANYARGCGCRYHRNCRRCLDCFAGPLYWRSSLRRNAAGRRLRVRRNHQSGGQPQAQPRPHVYCRGNRRGDGNRVHLAIGHSLGIRLSPAGIVGHSCHRRRCSHRHRPRPPLTPNPENPIIP